MADGDLVASDYVFEFNELALGVGTPYDLEIVNGLLGFTIHTSSTVAKFGRHGDSPGRHYANSKKVTFRGRIKSDSDTEFETNRTNLINAMSVIVNPDDYEPLVFQLPGATAKKYKVNGRPTDVEVIMDRAFARKYGVFFLQFEVPDPRIYDLTSTVTNFDIADGSDTQVINNSGSADAEWIGQLVGPCETPVLTHDGTGQSLGFAALTLSGSETLIYDSATSTAKVNGVSVSSSYTAGFSWFSLDPGNNSITLTATNSSTASFTITHNNAHWMV